MYLFFLGTSVVQHIAYQNQNSIHTPQSLNINVFVVFSYDIHELMQFWYFCVSLLAFLFIICIFDILKFHKPNFFQRITAHSIFNSLFIGTYLFIKLK